MNKSDKHIDKRISYFIIFVYCIIALFIVVTLIKPEFFDDLSYNEKKQELGLLINQAIKLAQEGSTNKSLSLFDEVISKMPDYTEAYVNKAVLFKKMNRYDDAVKLLKKSLEMKNIDSSNVYSNLKDIFIENKDTVKARKYFESSVLTANNLIEQYMKSGSFYLSIKQYDSALFYYKQALKTRFKPTTYIDDNNQIDSTKFNSFYDRRCFYIQLKHDKALAVNYNKIGVCLIFHQRFDEALKYFYKAKKIWDDYPEANYNINYILKKQKS